MHTFFQPKISVAQEEADIQELIDEEYERREQERDYFKALIWARRQKGNVLNNKNIAHLG